MFTSLQAARENAASFNWRMGTLISEITIPDGVQFEFDGPDERGHCNLYGLAAEDVRSWVTRMFWGPSSQPPSDQPS